jgi:hypothetical protein
MPCTVHAATCRQIAMLAAHASDAAYICSSQAGMVMHNNMPPVSSRQQQLSLYICHRLT